MPVPAGPKIRISDLIAIAAKQGCIVRFSNLRLVTASGIIPIRFLYNSANHGRFDITDYEDGEYLVASEVENAERRLQIKIL